MKYWISEFGPGPSLSVACKVRIATPFWFSLSSPVIMFYSIIDVKGMWRCRTDCVIYRIKLRRAVININNHHSELLGSCTWWSTTIGDCNRELRKWHKTHINMFSGTRTVGYRVWCSLFIVNVSIRMYKYRTIGLYYHEHILTFSWAERELDQCVGSFITIFCNYGKHQCILRSSLHQPTEEERRVRQISISSSTSTCAVCDTCTSTFIRYTHIRTCT